MRGPIRQVEAFTARPYRETKSYSAGTIATGEVSEGSVRLRHAMNVLPRGDGGPFTVVGVYEFLGKLLAHGPTRLIPHGVNDPPDRERLLPPSSNLHRDLIVASPNTFGADLNVRLDILDRRLKDLQSGRVLDASADDIHGIVKNAPRHALLAPPHQTVDELTDQLATEARIRLELSFRFCPSFVGHGTRLLLRSECTTLIVDPEPLVPVPDAAPCDWPALPTAGGVQPLARRPDWRVSNLPPFPPEGPPAQAASFLAGSARRRRSR